MSKQKLLFFDIDGTLVDETTHQISDSTTGAIHKAQQNGHLVFINTGRPYSNVDEKLRELGFDGYICGCGVYIQYHGQVLYHRRIPKEECRELAAMLHKFRMEGVLEGTPDCYYSETLSHPMFLQTKHLYEEYGFDCSKGWSDPDIQFEKGAVTHGERSDFNGFYQYITQKYDYIFRADDFGEFIPKGHSKATGIQYMVDLLGAELDDCFVFGDSTNDLPMLSYVKHSIAMASGNPALFNQVELVAPGIGEDGIEKALCHYQII